MADGPCQRPFVPARGNLVHLAVAFPLSMQQGRQLGVVNWQIFGIVVMTSSKQQW